MLFENLNFSLSAGELIQIEGQNGSGKTTLLRVLCGLSDDFDGQVLWRQEPYDKAQEDFSRSILYIGHAPTVKLALTPEENLEWLVSLHPSLTKMTVKAALKKVGLYGYEDVLSYTLSAGQQRRVSLARLHMSSAPLWILDEPFTALDKQAVKEKETLLSQHAQAGGSVIVTTHHDLSLPGANLRHINLDEVVTA